MIRLGLCCKFYKHPIKFKTTTAAYFNRQAAKGENPLHYLSEIILQNTTALKEAILYCIEHHIGCFRVGSDLFPLATHPTLHYQLYDLPQQISIQQHLQEAKTLAQTHNIRLTFHPSQFVVLSSPRPEVVEQSLLDLEHHNRLCDWLGADVINIHMGGAYGDKAAAIARFEVNFKQLSSGAQQRLTIENDDKIYSPDEILPTCKRLNIPLVYDVHHHRCLPDGLSIEKATQQALQTWEREPLFHISSPLNGWDHPKPGPHHDFIDIHDFPKEWRDLSNVTIEVEAKAKELALEKLYKELNA